MGHPIPSSLRECAAFLVLGVLIATVLATALTASAMVGGVLGVGAGLTAGGCTVQLLRRPAGRAIGRLVDA